MCQPKKGTPGAGLLWIPLLLVRGGEWAPREDGSLGTTIYSLSRGWSLQIDAGLQGIMQRRVPSTPIILLHHDRSLSALEEDKSPCDRLPVEICLATSLDQPSWRTTPPTLFRRSMQVIQLRSCFLLERVSSTCCNCVLYFRRLAGSKPLRLHFLSKRSQ
jgi:hypothetical protein